MKISMIAAVGRNRELGKDNRLLWNIPEDLARFRKITSGHPVIMGRKTFESIGRPLPNRMNIIVSRNPKSEIRNPKQIQNTKFKIQNYNSKLKSEDLIVVSSLEEGIEMAKQSEIERLSPRGGTTKPSTRRYLAKQSQRGEIAALPLVARNYKDGEVFIIGGGQLYSQGIKYADKLYLTVVDDEKEADTFFPDYSEFKKVVFEEDHELNGLKYKYLELEK